MKYTLTLLAFLFTHILIGQQLTIEDFEGFELEQDSFLNRTDDNEGFFTSYGTLPNTYDTEFDAWTGWSISNMKDTTTAGFTNQYSSIVGSGVDGSETYAVSYHYVPNHLQAKGYVMGGATLRGMHITNATYPYLSMRDGDMFAKKFGGVDGNDPDFFLLTVKGYTSEGSELIDSVDFFLADFRFDDNSLDYIVDKWNYVDLSSLGEASYFTFTLSSSDVGMFGVNTPNYFCIDNIEYDFFTSTEEVVAIDNLNVYPNPASDILNIEVDDIDSQQVTITNAQGQLMISPSINRSSSLDISHLQNGVYRVNINTAEGLVSKRFLKI